MTNQLLNSDPDPNPELWLDLLEGDPAIYAYGIGATVSGNIAYVPGNDVDVTPWERPGWAVCTPEAHALHGGGDPNRILPTGTFVGAIDIEAKVSGIGGYNSCSITLYTDSYDASFSWIESLSDSPYTTGETQATITQYLEGPPASIVQTWINGYIRASTGTTVEVTRWRLKLVNADGTNAVVPGLDPDPDPKPDPDPEPNPDPDPDPDPDPNPEPEPEPPEEVVEAKRQRVPHVRLDPTTRAGFSRLLRGEDVAPEDEYPLFIDNTFAPSE